ncbi:MAG: cupin domain-containing protein [Veillonella sp.]|nr:cupin domain-containing protein [Veillonella sp.]
MSKTFTKNIPVNEILHLGEHLEYKEGQVISITIAQNERLSITLFALPKGEEISTHVTVGKAGETLIMPSEVPHSLDARESFKMLLTVVK